MDADAVETSDSEGDADGEGATERDLIGVDDTELRIVVVGELLGDGATGALKTAIAGAEPPSVPPWPKVLSPQHQEEPDACVAQK